jgi:hypothetical protein
MRSIIVVTSWWSNCLALTCLHQLLEFAAGCEIFVIQAGKSDTQMGRFRRFLPEGITELLYPSELEPDDSAMREYLAKDVLRSRTGAWFFDHDTFLLSPADPFFEWADSLFSQSEICLCTRRPLPGAGVTQPAYWLSPMRWPPGLSSFAPVPFQPRPYTRRPDLHRHDGNLTIPVKDTLVQVREELETLHMTGTFPTDGDDGMPHFLTSFPQHDHIGGLHLYTGPTQPLDDMPPLYYRWRRHTLLSFDKFFRNCPQEWRAIENQELLRRHAEMMRTLETTPWNC